MSSPVFYQSTDTSAPVLTGTAGDLINLLNKCLVTGYGSQAAAGWTMPYTVAGSPTVQAVFRPGSGVQHYFHVDDNSPNVTAAGKEAQFRGSEGATGFQAGITNYFPTTAQIALGSGLVIRKSATADSTARAWKIVADDRTAYIFIVTGDGGYLCAAFGEFYSILNSTDLYRSFVIGRTSANSASASPDLFGDQSTTFATLGGHYIPRAYTGTGGAQAFGKFGDFIRGGASNFGAGTGVANPNGADGGLHIVPIHLLETFAANCVRGRMRGIAQVCQTSATFTDGDSILGDPASAYSGRTFTYVKGLVSSTSFNTGGISADLSGPWETN